MGICGDTVVPLLAMGGNREVVRYCWQVKLVQTLPHPLPITQTRRSDRGVSFENVVLRIAAGEQIRH